MKLVSICRSHYTSAMNNTLYSVALWDSGTNYEIEKSHNGFIYIHSRGRVLDSLYRPDCHFLYDQFLSAIKRADARSELKLKPGFQRYSHIYDALNGLGESLWMTL